MPCTNLSGRHCSLWCNIESKEMQKPRSERECASPRTLSTLASDFQQFAAAGSKHTQTKQHNNVIEDAILNISIHQVRKWLIH